MDFPLKLGKFSFPPLFHLSKAKGKYLEAVKINFNFKYKLLYRVRGLELVALVQRNPLRIFSHFTCSSVTTVQELSYVSLGSKSVVEPSLYGAFKGLIQAV